jgi:hypothetical protein
MQAKGKRLLRAKVENAKLALAAPHNGIEGCIGFLRIGAVP